VVPTAAAPPGSRRLEGATFGAFLAFAATVQFSIALATALLALAGLGWIGLLWRQRRLPSAPGFFLPLLAYAAWTLVSSGFSLDPAGSFLDSRQLLLLAIVPMACDVVPRRRATLVALVLISVGAASAAVGIVQYSLLQFDTLGRLPQGTLSHYMTYAGTLMLVIGIAAARVIFDARHRAWPALVLPALAVALVLTFTRNAWVGALAGVALLLLLRDYRLVALLPVVVALVFGFAPERITARMTSMFDLKDPSNQDRLAMTRTAAAISADRPLTGDGPNMIPRVYVPYRDRDAVHDSNPHLHNVPLQIAAERGLPALAAWVWFVVAAAAGLIARWRREHERAHVAAALAALAAMISAGLFEHNFGDSEFLMLFLLILTLPFTRDLA
jgi:O-antigen ligase